MGTEPSAPTSYATTVSVAVLNPVTHRLEPYVEKEANSTTRASIVAGVSQPALLVDLNAPNVLPGAGQWSKTYVDSKGHSNRVIFFYPPTGGPPGASEHWFDGKLLNYTRLYWTRIPTGWYNSKLVQSTYALDKAIASTYTVTGTYTAVTKPCTAQITTNCVPATMVRNIGPIRRVVGGFALALAYSCIPADALAQVNYQWGACAAEWLAYISAAGAVAAAIGLAPETLGATLIGLGVATTAAASAYVFLMKCINAANRAQNGSGGGGDGGGVGTPGMSGCDGVGGVTPTCIPLWTQ